MSSGYQPDPEMVQFLLGKPVMLNLKFDDPRECAVPGRFLYTMTDGRKMFVGRKVVEAITYAGIRAGTPFWMTKRAKDVFVVSAEDPRRAGGPVEASLPEGSTRLARELARSVDHVQARRRPEPAPPSPHGELAVPAAPAPRPPAVAQLPQPGGERPRTQLEAALCTAVEACYRAQEFGRGLGYGVTFTSEDLRAMAITLVINAADRERGRRSA